MPSLALPSPVANSADGAAHPQQLARSLGVGALVLYGLGIIGAGIYVLVGEAAAAAGGGASTAMAGITGAGKDRRPHLDCLAFKANRCRRSKPQSLRLATVSPAQC